MTPGNAAFIAIVVVAAWLVSLLDPDHRATRDARREERVQRRYDRAAARQAAQVAKDREAYCRRRWNRVDTYEMANPAVAANERARLIAEGIEDPRR